MQDMSWCWKDLSWNSVQFWALQFKNKQFEKLSEEQWERSQI